MTFEFLIKYPFIYQRLIKKLGYYSERIYGFADNKLMPCAKDNKSIFIVAKAHYKESWQAFSAVNKAELNKIIALKKNTEHEKGSIFQVIENKNIDGFDVKTIKFDEAVFQALGHDCILIPESEIIHTQTNQIIEVKTPRGLLFSSLIGHKINSAYAQGLINNINTYKLSVGLPNNVQVISINENDFPAFIIQRLIKLPIKQLVNKIQASPKNWVDWHKLHWFYGAPLLTALIFYVFTNAYLAIQINSIESSLSQEGSEVSAILKNKRTIDDKSALLSTLSNELSTQQLTHSYWQIVGQMLEHGTTITRITYKNNELIIRGNAAVASTVLANIAESSYVKSASFEGPVRSSRGEDSFVMIIVPKEQI